MTFLRIYTFYFTYTLYRIGFQCMAAYCIDRIGRIYYYTAVVEQIYNSLHYTRVIIMGVKFLNHIACFILWLSISKFFQFRIKTLHRQPHYIEIAAIQFSNTNHSNPFLNPVSPRLIERFIF